MVKQEKPKEVNLGTFRKEEDIQLLNKLDTYIDLLNKGKDSNKLNRLGFIRNAIKKELKGKVLDNSFITLPKPYFFNMEELLKEGTVEATNVPPIKDLEKCYVLFNVPNNLDIWKPEDKTYCFNNVSYLHRGYYIKEEYSLKENDYEVTEETDLVFNFNSKTLEVDIAVSHDRDIYFTQEMKEGKEKIFKPTFYHELGCVAVVDGLHILTYEDYKYFILDESERFKEDKEFYDNPEGYVTNLIFF